MDELIRQAIMQATGNRVMSDEEKVSLLLKVLSIYLKMNI